MQVWSHAFSIKACFLDGIIAKQQPFWGILKLIITSRVKDFEPKYIFAFSSPSRSSVTVLSHLLICSKYGNCLYVTGLSLLLQGHFIYHGYQLIKLLVEKKKIIIQPPVTLFNIHIPENYLELYYSDILCHITLFPKLF